MPANPLEFRMSHLEGAYEQASQRLNSIDARLTSIETRFASIDARFTSIDARFTSIDSRLDGLDRKIDQRFMWTIGAVLGSWATTNATMLALFLHR